MSDNSTTVFEEDSGSSWSAMGYVALWGPFFLVSVVLAIGMYKWWQMRQKYLSREKEKDLELKKMREELEEVTNNLGKSFGSLSAMQQTLGSSATRKDIPRRSTSRTGSVASVPCQEPKPRRRPAPILTTDPCFEHCLYTPPPPHSTNASLPPLSGCNHSPISESAVYRRLSMPLSPSEGMRVRRDSTFPKTWQRGQLLGSGSFGSVYMGIRPNGTFFAVKVMKLHDQLAMERLIELKREVDLMSDLKHPNIVRYLGVTIAGDELNIFMEYIQNGLSLGALSRTHGQKLSEATVASYTKQILFGVQFLHANAIIHRDLKGDNILIAAEGAVKLADFGTSKKVQPHAEKTHISGTPLWMAPEAITCPEGITLKADIWSVGCVVCELLNNGKPPWPAKFESQWQAMYTIGNWKEELPPEIPEGLPKELMELLGFCFKLVPDDRKSATELLLHQWFINHEDDASETGSDGSDSGVGVVTEKLQKLIITRSNNPSFSIQSPGTDHLASSKAATRSQQPTEVRQPDWLRTASSFASSCDDEVKSAQDMKEYSPPTLSELNTGVKVWAPSDEEPSEATTNGRPVRSNSSSPPIIVPPAPRKIISPLLGGTGRSPTPRQRPDSDPTLSPVTSPTLAHLALLAQPQRSPLTCGIETPLRRFSRGSFKGTVFPTTPLNDGSSAPKAARDITL